MKKVFLLASAFCFAYGAQAQVTVKLAPEIGINVGNIKGEHAGFDVDYKSPKLGVKAGVNADIMLGSNFAIQPGLFYSIKGGKGDETTVLAGNKTRVENNITLHYFEVPVNFQYYFNDPGEGRFFIGVGGYLGVPFSGKNKYRTTLNEGVIADGTKKLKFGQDNLTNDWERFDAGISANAGYYLRSGIFFRAMIQRGLMNNMPAGDADNSYKLNTYTLSLGYMIGGKR